MLAPIEDHYLQSEVKNQYGRSIGWKLNKGIQANWRKCPLVPYSSIARLFVSHIHLVPAQADACANKKSCLK
jgi:hypothetical protein